MGHRANLIVIENGRRELYYSHWCATILDRQLFWGPALATAYARQQRSQREGAELLDEVWAEGGVIIDHDRRTLLWFGGGDINYEIPVRRVLLQMMSSYWPQWRVQWAAEGIAQLAEYLGISVASVLVSAEPPDCTLSPPGSDDYYQTIISSCRDGVTEIFTVADFVEDVLQAGCAVDALLRALSGVSTLRVPDAEFPNGGVHLDWDRRSVACWFAPDLPAIRVRTQLAFPGWLTTCWEDAYEAHAAAAPGLTFPAFDPVLLGKRIVASLLQEDRDRAAAFASALESVAGATDVNPFALRDDPQRLTSARRRELLQLHFSAWLPE